MSRLAIVSTVLGTLVVATRLPGVIAPDKVRPQMLAFPRSVWAGRILMAVVALWAGWFVYNAATDEWAKFRPLIVVGIPVAYWLTIQYADQYLAVRGAAALMLFISKVMLDAADIHDSPLRLVVSVLAYLWVIAAMWMAIAPHHMRDLIQFFMANNTRCRVASAVGLSVGLALLVLGALVY